MTCYYHRTTAKAAAAILRSGFQDGVGTDRTDSEHRGVWLSDVPLYEGAEINTLLVIEAPAEEIEPYECIVEGKPYRELLVPAEVVNRHAGPGIGNGSAPRQRPEA